MELENNKGLIVEIKHDEFAESSRQWDNFGTMLCYHPKYILGDEQFNPDDFAGWMELQKSITKKEGKILSLPLNLHDHSGISMKVGSSRGWDNGQVGFIYVSYKKIEDEYGRIHKGVLEEATDLLVDEVAEYSTYLEGEVYDISVRNQDGEVIDSLCNVYGLENAQEQAKEMVDNYTPPRDSARAKSAQQIH